MTRVSTGLAVPSLIARAGGELVFTHSPQSAFVDARTWPPRVTVLPHYVADAARGTDGRWIVHGPEGVLREYPSIATGAAAGSEEPVPVPERDFAPFVAHLEPSRRRIELAHSHRVESLHVCGTTPIVVPRHVGLGERRHPYLRRRDGWREETSLPPFTKTVEEHTARCAVACTRLADGTDVLIWDGHVFAWDGDTFSSLFDYRLELHWYRQWQPVPAPGGGLFSVDGDALVELVPGDVRRHLPGVKVFGVHPGPHGTIIIGNPLQIYDPADDSIATIPEDLLGKRSELVGYCDDGSLVALERRRNYELFRISASDLAALPRRRASIAPVIVPPPPLAARDDVGAASRATVAAAGDRIVLCTGYELRFHVADAAAARLSMVDRVVAVACVDEYMAALDASGTLALFRDPRTWDEPISIEKAARALVASTRGELLVLCEERAWFVDPATLARRELAVARGLGAAADPDTDTVLVIAEDHRLAYVRGGVLVDLPPSAEQLIAVAALGRNRFACAGEHNLFLLDVAHGELEALYRTCGAPLLASHGTRIAWCTSPTMVIVGEVEGATLTNLVTTAYPSTFSEPDDAPLAIRGLAFADRDRLVVALDAGRGNILDLRTTRAHKLDPHPGDPISRWVFVFGGAMLVAG